MKTDRPLANKRSCCGFSRLQARESETVVAPSSIYIYIYIHTLLLSLVSLFSAVSCFKIYLSIYIYIKLRRYVPVCVYVCLYECVYICIYVCMYNIHTYIYIYICMGAWVYGIHIELSLYWLTSFDPICAYIDGTISLFLALNGLVIRRRF